MWVVRQSPDDKWLAEGGGGVQLPKSNTVNTGVVDGQVVGYCQLDIMKYSADHQGS